MSGTDFNKWNRFLTPFSFNDREVYSFHPGGANAVFADGHVQFMSATVSIQTLAALVTRAGGELAPLSDY